MCISNALQFHLAMWHSEQITAVFVIIVYTCGVTTVYCFTAVKVASATKLNVKHFHYHHHHVFNKTCNKLHVL